MKGLAFVHIRVFLSDVFAFGYNYGVGDGVCSSVVDEEDGTYARHVLLERQGMEPSGGCFSGVEILLVYFVHAIVDNKLDELFE